MAASSCLLYVLTSCTPALSAGKKRKPDAVQRSIWGSVDHMGATEQQQLAMLFAKAVYLTGMPLSAFEHPAWTEFFLALRPAFKKPSR
jgi:hypothetical protein